MAGAQLRKHQMSVYLSNHVQKGLCKGVCHSLITSIIRGNILQQPTACDFEDHILSGLDFVAAAPILPNIGLYMAHVAGNYVTTTWQQKRTDCKATSKHHLYNFHISSGIGVSEEKHCLLQK